MLGRGRMESWQPALQLTLATGGRADLRESSGVAWSSSCCSSFVWPSSAKAGRVYCATSESMGLCVACVGGGRGEGREAREEGRECSDGAGWTACWRGCVAARRGVGALELSGQAASYRRLGAPRQLLPSLVQVCPSRIFTLCSRPQSSTSTSLHHLSAWSVWPSTTEVT